MTGRKATILVAALLCMSCSSPPGPPPLYPVKGQVFYQEEPAAGALVVFHPHVPGDSALSLPLAVVDADGWFELVTDFRAQGQIEAYEGARPGVYDVVVEWRKPPAVTDREPEDVPDFLDGRYADPKTSGIRVEVNTGNNVLSAFRLE